MRIQSVKIHFSSGTSITFGPYEERPCWLRDLLEGIGEREAVFVVEAQEEYVINCAEITFYEVKRATSFPAS